MSYNMNPVAGTPTSPADCAQNRVAASYLCEKIENRIKAIENRIAGEIKSVDHSTENLAEYASHDGLGLGIGARP